MNNEIIIQIMNKNFKVWYLIFLIVLSRNYFKANINGGLSIILKSSGQTKLLLYLKLDITELFKVNGFHNLELDLILVFHTYFNQNILAFEVELFLDTQNAIVDVFL